MKNALFATVASLFIVSTSAWAWEPMCGFADQLQNYIRENSHEKVATQVLFRGKQGETARFIKVFESGDWLVTFEFFSDASPDLDVSCLIDSGKAGDEAAVDYVTRLISKLPEARFKDFGKNPQDYEPMKNFVPAPN